MKARMEEQEEHSVSTPIGAVRYCVENGKLTRLHFSDAIARGKPRDPIGRELAAYFEGDRAALRRIPVQLDGTPFHLEVWRALRRLRPGTTISYAELARRIGRPTAVRAVARANAANKIALVVPCHRVVGTSGKLVGYNFGIERKAWLLRFEGVAVAEPATR